MICKCVTWFVSMALFCSPVLLEDVCKKEYMIQNSIIRSSPASAHQRKTEYCLLAISLGCITGCCHCKICQKLVDLILFPLPLYLVSMNCGSFDSNIQSFSCSGHYYREALRKKLVCQRSFQLGCSTKKKRSALSLYLIHLLSRGRPRSSKTQAGRKEGPCII